MQTLFFRNIPDKYKVAYRNHYTGQNLATVRSVSFIFLILNLIIRLLAIVFPNTLTRAENFPEFNIANWAFIFGAIVFHLFSYPLIEAYLKTKKATVIMALFIFCFSLYIICGGMYSSFIAMSNPRNSLTVYLIGLTVISVLMVLEYYETIILIIAVELLFTVILIHYHTDATEMLYNQLTSFVLLTGFYLISRYFFSYKANYYLQVLATREKTEELERAGEFKNQLLGMVAHDLRNPIAAVESIAMMMEMDDIDEDTQDNLTMIKTSCVKARHIIDDLLNSARDENVLEFSTKKTELNSFLLRAIDGWKLQSVNKNIIELISSVSPAYAMIDQEKFQRVIDNLISNALKFSGERQGIELFLFKREKELAIEIKDHGLGIPKDLLPFIFDRFSKAGRAGLKGERSTGLGLSIVKHIIEKHNGKISVESEEGKGSTFRIVLPAV